MQPTPGPIGGPLYADASRLQPAIEVPPHLLGSDRFADVSIQMADGGPPVPAHRLILCSGACEFFHAALETASGFDVAEQANSGAHVILHLPVDISRTTLLLVLRWLYTGIPPNEPLEKRPDMITAAGDEVFYSCTEEASTSRIVQSLVAADGLGIDCLRSACEKWMCDLVDQHPDQVVEVLLYGENLHCPTLVSYCHRVLRAQYGAWRRCHRHCGSQRSVAPAMSDAVALTSLSGFDNLGESARASIAYHLGLPKAALRGRSSEQIQSAHSSAVRLNEGATVEIFGMRGRTDLNGQSATLLTFQPSKGEGNGNGGRQQDDRWACRIAGTGEQVRVRVGLARARKPCAVVGRGGGGGGGGGGGR